MKTLLTAALVAASQILANAQDKNPVVSPTPITTQSVITNIFTAKAASFVVSPALLGSKVGFGLAVLYPVGEYAFAGVRVDVLDGSYTAPSAIVGARYTVKNFPLPFVKDVTFLSYGGLFMAVGGAQEDNHVVQGVTGIGASATVWKINENFNLSVAIAAEKLTEQTSPIIRPAAAVTWHF